MKKLILVIFLASFSLSMEGNSGKSFALQVEDFYQTPNYKFPWRKEGVRKKKILAIKILHRGKTYFVTMEHLIHQSVKLVDSSSKKNFLLKWVDSERNLAFLEPPEDFKAGGVESFELSEEVPFGLEAEFYARIKRKFQKSDKLKIKDLSLEEAPFSAYKFLHYRVAVKESSTDFSHGGVLFSRNKLIGLCSKIENSYASCIPSFTIKKSLENFLSGAKRSHFPSLRFELSGLKNPLIYPHRGQLPKGILEDDVILEIDGLPLDDNQEISHRLWKKVNYRYLLEKKNVGDSLQLLIEREGNKMNLSLSLTAQDSNTGPVLYSKDSKEELHFFVGGLVFQRLSLEYLMSYGSDWESKIPSEFYYILNYGRRNGFLGDAVIISHVLPGGMSKGYESLKNSILEKSSASSLVKFSDLKREMNPLSKKMEIFFRYGGGSLLLKPEMVEKEEKLVKKIYDL